MVLPTRAVLETLYPHLLLPSFGRREQQSLIQMTNKLKLIGVALGIVLIMAMSGCGESDNRMPSTAEVKAADANRQKLIDNLNIPEDQKVQMRAHMGGSGAPNPADAARASAAAASGGNNVSQGGRRN